MGLLDARITIPDAVLHQRLDDETIMLHLNTEHYYGLDEIGSRIWQLLDDGTAGDSIVAALVDDFEVDEATLRTDLESLLEELLSLGLIQVDDGSST